MKKRLTIFAFVAIFVVLAFFPQTLNAALPDEPGGPSSGSCITGSIAQFKDLECIFNKIVSNLIPLGGIIFFVMFLIGGFRFITSAGDPKALAAANQTITYAVIGLVLCALSYVVLLLISYVTGNTSILNFTIVQ